MKIRVFMLVFFALGLGTCQVLGQKAFIPDASFRQALRSENPLFLDDKDSLILSVANSYMYSLDFHYRNVKNVSKRFDDRK